MSLCRKFRSTVALKSVKTWCTATFSTPWSFVVPKSIPSDSTLIKLARGSSPSVLPYKVLPYDILVIIFEFVSDAKTLFNACLVSTAFDDAANLVLWRRLTDDPLRSKVRILMLAFIAFLKRNLLMSRIQQLVTMKKTRCRLVRSLFIDSEETYRGSIVKSASYFIVF